MLKTKYIVVLALSALIGWSGWSIYSYFFDRSLPVISMAGINQDDHYAGDITCHVSTSKTGDLAVYLDDQPLIKQFKLSKRAQNNPFTFPTKAIADGQHTIKIELTDRTYRKNKTSLTRSFVIDNSPLQAAFIKSESEYKVFQGRTLHVQFQVNKPVKEANVAALGANFSCVPESPKSNIYECFIPISCEETPNEYPCSVAIKDHVGNSLNMDNKFQIVMYPFKKQVLVISQETIKKEKEAGLAMNQLEVALQQLSEASPAQKLWRGSFVTPIDIAKITCDFGTIRTTQEKGRYMHKALDVINQPRSIVWAPQDGVVVLKERYAHSGNTVVIDHGCGILSLFFHLEDFADVAVGQKVTKGNPIGTLGKTGFATGYHLHWEMRVNNVAIDPMQWTKPNF